MGNRTARGITAAEVLALLARLPGVEQHPHGNHIGFRVRGQGFGYLCADDQTLLIKATRQEQAVLIADDPRAYKKANSAGRIGWVLVRLPKVHRDELADLVTEAWRLTAPRQLVADHDPTHELTA